MKPLNKTTKSFSTDSKGFKEHYVKQVADLYRYEREIYLNENKVTDENLINGSPGGIVYYADCPAHNTLTLELPDIPPFINKYDKLKSSDRITIRNHWTGRIIKAVEEFRVNNSYDKNLSNTKKLVIIEAFKNMVAPWDPDNLIVKFILDGLRYAKVIPDDNYKNIKVSLIGNYVEDIEKQMTKIYVVDISKYESFLEIYNFKNDIRTDDKCFPEFN